MGAGESEVQDHPQLYNEFEATISETLSLRKISQWAGEHIGTWHVSACIHIQTKLV